MSTVTVYTAARMQEIEDGAIVDGDVVGDNLILTKHDGSTINAGNVRGATGEQGDPGEVTYDYLNGYLPKYTTYADLLDDTTANAALVYLNSSLGYIYAHRIGGVWHGSVGPVQFSGTTDEFGAVYLAPETYGFVSWYSAVASVDWGAELDTAQLGSCRIASDLIQIRAFVIFSDQTTAFGAIVPLADTAITGDVMMTGKWV